MQSADTLGTGDIRTFKKNKHLFNANILQQELCHLCQASSLVGSERWMCAEEAASYLSISVGALRNLTSTGQVPYYKLGKRNRYLKEELDKMLKKEPRGTR